MVNIQKQAQSSKVVVVFTGIVLVGLAVVAYYVLPDPVDWTIFYRPATIELLSGRTPYSVGSFFNPPWILVPLIPFALLPFRVGVVALFAANFIIFLFIGRALKARPVAYIALFCSLPVLVCLLFGQIDGLALLGLFMPRWLGLIFLMAKPQIGWVIAVFWLVEAWREGKLKRVALTFSPVVGLFLLSFLLYGFWPLDPDIAGIFATNHNTSLWPGSIVVGLPLLVYALRRRKEGMALIASPFLSPYLSPQSWVIALLGLIPYELEMVAASLASWVFFLSKI